MVLDVRDHAKLVLVSRRRAHGCRNCVSISRLFAVIFLAFAGYAHAACTFVSPTLTCTAGQAASVTTTGNFANVKANPYPATLVVSGAPAGSSITGVKIVLHGLNADGTNGVALSGNGLLLASPARNMEILHAVGDPNASNPFPTVSNVTLTIEDGNGAVAAPNQTTSLGTQVNTSLHWKPSSYSDIGIQQSNKPGTSPSPAPPNGFATKIPATLGTDTLNGVFSGDSPTGTWNLYMVDDFTNDAVSVGSWDLVLTVSASAVSTTTSLTSS